MPKISWNDIDDEDSSLSSEGQQIQEYVPQKKLIYPSTSKLKNACDQMSLRKLQNHQNNEVWLYIPNSFYQRGDDVNAILENNKQLKKVYRNKLIGWNVLTSKEAGRRLIEEGLQEGNIFIKFIYSNKNQQRLGSVEQRAKLQKKVTYVQKTSKLIPQEQKRQQMKEEETWKAQKKEQVQEKGEKKKMKYILKSKTTITDPNQSISESIKQTSIKTTQSFKSPTKILQKNNFKSPKKYRLKQQRAQLQKDNNEQKKIQQASLPLANTISIKSQGMDTQSQPIKDIQQNKEDDLSSDQSIQKQQKKKKKKKNNKKSKGAKVQKLDQNPYSYFMK